jgi:hypothetical protein
MTRVNVYLTDKQFQEITLLAKQAGVTFSEMLRRILDQKIETNVADVQN